MHRSIRSLTSFITSKAMEMKGIVSGVPRGVVALFGDSLTEQGSMASSGGWAAAVAEHFGSSLDVVNRGTSGYNTAVALRYLQDAEGMPFNPLRVNPHQPLKAVVVWFGANDAALEGEPQHVPLLQYQDNLKSIVELLRRAYYDTLPVIAITPPLVDEEMWLRRCRERYGDHILHSNRIREVSVEYSRICAATISAMKHTAIVPLHELMSCHDDGVRALLSDGLHLSKSGNAVVAQALTDTMERAFPELSPDVLQRDCLPWQDAVNALKHGP